MSEFKLNRDQVQELVRAALQEDVGSGDLTTEATVPQGQKARGSIISKQEMIVAGLEVACIAFQTFDPHFQWTSQVQDGDQITSRTTLLDVAGEARALLTSERVALNFLQRLSGIATLTRRFVDTVAGTGARIRDTRKTTPLLRSLEKYAVAVGGGTPHRMGLSTGILIKDNHVRLTGSVLEATRRALEHSSGLLVEVEVERLEQIDEALKAGAQMILLDNFTPDLVRQAIKKIARRVPVEVSGGIRLENVREYAEAGPDFIAVGALTHSAPAVDISFEIKPAS